MGRHGYFFWLWCSTTSVSFFWFCNLGFKEKGRRQRHKPLNSLRRKPLNSVRLWLSEFVPCLVVFHPVLSPPVTVSCLSSCLFVHCLSIWPCKRYRRLGGWGGDRGMLVSFSLFLSSPRGPTGPSQDTKGVTKGFAKLFANRTHNRTHKRIRKRIHKKIRKKSHKRIHKRTHKRTHNRTHKRIHKRTHKKIHKKTRKRI